MTDLEGHLKSLINLRKDTEKDLLVQVVFIQELTIVSERPQLPPSHHTISIVINCVIGAVLVGFLMFLVLYGPAQFSEQQTKIVRFLAATAGGLLSALFLGRLHLGGTVPYLSDVQIAAAGGFAVFIFVMIFWAH
jgi:hypothetical protein